MPTTQRSTPHHNPSYFPWSTCIVVAVFVLAAASARAATNRVAIVIHADPGYANDANFARLSQVVRRADSNGHKLTIQLGGSSSAIAAEPAAIGHWGQHITATAKRRSFAVRWATNGHRFGVHHHDRAHVNPDDYCFNHVVGCFPVTQLYAELTRGTTSTTLGPLLVSRTGDAHFGNAGHGPSVLGDSPDYRVNEWQAGVRYGLGSNIPASGVSRTVSTAACIWAYPSVPKGVAEVATKPFNVGVARRAANTTTVANILADFESATTDQVVTVVFHARDYNDDASTKLPGGATDKDRIDQLLSGLSGAGRTSATLKTLLDSANPCGW